MTTKRDSSKLIFKAIVTLNYRSATPPGRLSSSLKTLLRCETLQALSAQVALKNSNPHVQLAVVFHHPRQHYPCLKIHLQKAHQTRQHQEKKALALALNPTHAPQPILGLIQAPEWCPILGLIPAPEWCLGVSQVASFSHHLNLIEM
ncbi:hypothetical protein OIU79_015086 [Salix purpurea]|uniref:Uncharacterized protein n=1 Tax=Salix purpurea TaxID=77065 RepID=A0A9Q0PB02_SALPP|nr:hypothetical protein OIU79_015086 [Salix purpurea]